MRSTRPAPVTAEQAPVWTSQSYIQNDYTRTLTRSELAEITAALDIARIALAGKDMLYDRTVSTADFPLPTVGALLAATATGVAAGRGFAVLRGLPVEALSEADCAILIRGLAAHLGQIATQSRDGQLLRHVRATGQALGDAHTRGHQTAERLWFHTDGADAAVLLCRRAARTGGLSRVASAAAVHNLMLAEAPDLVAALYEPFHFHMAGGNVNGLPPTFVSPIFATDRGFSCRYVRHTLLETPTVTGVALPAKAREAFDLLETVADRVAVDMVLEPGGLQIVNNATVLHSRTSYTDPEDPDQARLLLRAWLTFPEQPGRRIGLVDQALRYGWLTDDIQRRLAEQWQAPVLVGPAT